VSTANSFKGLEEELDDASTNSRRGKITNFPPIFIARVDNFSSLSQLLKEVAVDEYEIKIINEQIKIQPKSSIAYINNVKELKSKNTKFHIYKPKQERILEWSSNISSNSESGCYQKRNLKSRIYY
jgi:hypothetical protein